MSITLAVALYFLLWWTLLFAVLPLFRGATQEEAGDVEPGTPASAPSRTPVLKIVLINSVLAAVMLALVALAMKRYLPAIGAAIAPT
jgi:predicted secreted protein